MAKGVLTFKLPEEQEAFHTACRAEDWKAVVWDLDQYLRSRLKYEDLPEIVCAALGAVRDKLHEELQNRNLDLD